MGPGSRELLLACDADGTITWADDRAGRLVDATTARRFVDLAVAGTEAKATSLLAAAAAAEVTATRFRSWLEVSPPRSGSPGGHPATAASTCTGS